MGSLDHGSKRMAARDRRAFLHVAGCLPLHEKASVIPWERELVASQKIADHLFVIKRKGEEAHLEHVESLASWKRKGPREPQANSEGTRSGPGGDRLRFARFP